MRDTGLRFVNLLLHFVVVLCLALACRAQGASNIPNTISIQASGAPSGACGNNFVYTNSATNDFYNCVAGAWNKVTSAGGGSVSLTATAPVVMTPSPTTGTGVASCPTCVTSSSPGVGLAHFAGSTQAVTSSAVNLAGADVTGNLPVTNLNSGTSASSSTFWRGDATWAAPSAGGALVQLETHTASTSSALSFTTCISGSSYHVYHFQFTQVTPSTNGDTLQMLVSTNGGSTYDTGATNYVYVNTLFNSGGNGQSGSGGAASALLAGNGMSSGTTSGGLSGNLDLYDPLDATHWTNWLGTSHYYNGGTLTENMTSGSWVQTTAVNAVQFKYNGADTIASGVITCYGVTP